MYTIELHPAFEKSIFLSGITDSCTEFNKFRTIDGFVNGRPGNKNLEAK